MPLSLLREARDQINWFGSIGPLVAERLAALGYNVPALENRLLHDTVKLSAETYDELRGQSSCPACEGLGADRLDNSRCNYCKGTGEAS